MTRHASIRARRNPFELKGTNFHGGATRATPAALPHPFPQHFVRSTATGTLELMERETGQCTWPFDTPEGPRFCGEPCAPGTKWCDNHRSIGLSQSDDDK